jgi:DNA-directed RNA polymerase subunit RPC12/RpoP
MIYEYKCPVCGWRTTSTERGDRLQGRVCHQCGHRGPMHRVFSISVRPAMQEHFNPTVGKPISSMRQFDDELKRKSEEYTLRTGIEAKFVSHDPHEAKSLGVTNEGLDSTNAKRAEQGLRPVVPKL